jgi:hypothetical protein
MSGEMPAGLVVTGDTARCERCWNTCPDNPDNNPAAAHAA